MRRGVCESLRCRGTSKDNGQEGIPDGKPVSWLVLVGEDGRIKTVPGKIVGDPERPALATTRCAAYNMAGDMSIRSVFDVLYRLSILNHRHRSSVRVVDWETSLHLQNNSRV